MCIAHKNAFYDEIELKLPEISSVFSAFEACNLQWHLHGWSSSVVLQKWSVTVKATALRKVQICAQESTEIKHIRGPRNNKEERQKSFEVQMYQPLRFRCSYAATCTHTMSVYPVWCKRRWIRVGLHVSMLASIFFTACKIQFCSVYKNYRPLTTFHASYFLYF